MRKGYGAEYKIKKELQKQYGEYAVIKVAISQRVPDYLVITKNLRVDTNYRSFDVIAIEVKSTVKKKLEPKPRDIQQWHTFRKWSQETNIPIQYRVKIQKKWTTYTLKEFGEKYVRGKLDESHGGEEVISPTNSFVGSLASI